MPPQASQVGKTEGAPRARRANAAKLFEKSSMKGKWGCVTWNKWNFLNVKVARLLKWGQPWKAKFRKGTALTHESTPPKSTLNNVPQARENHSSEWIAPLPQFWFTAPSPHTERKPAHVLKCGKPTLSPSTSKTDSWSTLKHTSYKQNASTEISILGHINKHTALSSSILETKKSELLQLYFDISAFKPYYSLGA